jgi:hypothetical protein
MTRHFQLRLLHERFALARIAHGQAIVVPPGELFAAMIHAPEGVTLACLETAVPDGAESRRGFRCLEVDAVFDLDSVGVVAAITRPLAEAGVSLFVFSTWQTDYILVGQADLEKARAALGRAGHRVIDSAVRPP